MTGLRLQPADVRLAAIFVILAVLAALITWLFAPTRTQGSFHQQPSTFFNTGYGTKAFYLSLDEMGVNVRRIRHALTFDQLYDLNGLVILEPIAPLDERERAEVLEWIYSGGTLLLGPGELGVMEIGIPFVQGSHPEGDHSEHESNPSGPTHFGADSGNALQGADASADSLLDGIGQLELGDATDRLNDMGDADLQPGMGPIRRVYSDHLGTYIIHVTFGQGQIILLADAYPLTNMGISKKDNAVLAANLAMSLATHADAQTAVDPGRLDTEPSEQTNSEQAMPFGTIGFDEYHLGFGQRDTTAVAMARLVWEGPYAWALIQVGLVGMIALLAGTWRFGRPRDLPPIHRRHRADFARAAGQLLQDACEGPRRLAVLADHHRGKWCKAVHLPAHVSNDRLAQAIAQRCGEQVLPLLNATGKLRMQDALDDLELLDLAQSLHRVTEVLEHGIASRR